MVNFNYTSQEILCFHRNPSLFLFVHVFLPYLYLFTERKKTVWHKCSLVIEMSALPLHCLMTTLWAEYATLVLCVTDIFQQSSYRVKLQGQSWESGPALVFMVLLCDLPHIVSPCPPIASWESHKVTRTSSVLCWSRSCVNQRQEISN